MYVLKSGKDGTYYIGTTSDLTNRVCEHNFGRTGYTKSKRPWNLMYHEDFETRGLAMIREKQLKRIKNRSILEKIIGEGP